jgi:hypothetical protein
MWDLVIVSANECRRAAKAYSLGFQPQEGATNLCALKGRWL